MLHRLGIEHRRRAQDQVDEIIDAGLQTGGTRQDGRLKAMATRAAGCGCMYAVGQSSDGLLAGAHLSTLGF